MTLQTYNEVFPVFLAVDGGGQGNHVTPTTARRTRRSFQGLGGSGATSPTARKLYLNQRVGAMSDISEVVGQTDLREARLQHFSALVGARAEAHGLAPRHLNLRRALAPSQRRAIEQGRYPRQAVEQLADTIALVASLWAGQVPAGWTAVVQCYACGQVPAPPDLVGPVARCPWCPARESGQKIPRPSAPMVRTGEGVT